MSAYPVMIEFTSDNASAIGFTEANSLFSVELTDLNGKVYNPTFQRYGDISYLESSFSKHLVQQLTEFSKDGNEKIDTSNYMYFTAVSYDLQIVIMEEETAAPYTLNGSGDTATKVHTTDDTLYNGNSTARYIVATNKSIASMKFTNRLYKLVNAHASSVDVACYRFTQIGGAQTTLPDKSVTDIMSYSYYPVDDGGTKVEITVESKKMQDLFHMPNLPVYFEIQLKSDSRNVLLPEERLSHEYDNNGIEHTRKNSRTKTGMSAYCSIPTGQTSTLQVEGVTYDYRIGDSSAKYFYGCSSYSDSNYSDCTISFVTYALPSALGEIKINMFDSNGSNAKQITSFTKKLSDKTENTYIQTNTTSKLHGLIQTSPRHSYKTDISGNCYPLSKNLATCFVSLENSFVYATLKDGSSWTIDRNTTGISDKFDQLWKLTQVKIGLKDGSVKASFDILNPEGEVTDVRKQATNVYGRTYPQLRQTYTNGQNDSWISYVIYGDQNAGRRDDENNRGFNHIRNFSMGGALSGFEAVVVNNGKDIEIQYDLSFDFEGLTQLLGDKANDIVSLSAIPQACVSQGAVTESRSISSTEDMLTYYMAPFVHKVASTTNAQQTSYSFEDTMIPGTIVNNENGISEFYLGNGIAKALEENKFGEEGSEYSKEARDILAKYFTVKDLSIIQKSRINAQKKAVVLNKGIVNPNYVLTPITEAELTAKNIELPEDAYDVSGNLFLYKLTKADGTTFSANDTFEVTYDLELDMDAIPGTLQTNLRNADFYQGGSLMLTTQAVFAYQGATKMLAAGGWVKNQYLQTPCVKKKQIYSSNNGSKQVTSWEIAYDSHTAGKTAAIENVTLRDVMTVDLFGLADTEKKKAIEQIAFQYLTTENVKYYIADANNQGAKTELSIGENADGLTVALDIKEANPSWVNNGQTGTTQ